MRSDGLIISKKEQLVLYNRSTDTAAEFIICERVLRCAGFYKVIFRIEFLVAVVFVRRSVKLVRTRLADLNNDGTAGFAVLCRHAVLLNAKLPDRLDRWLNVLTAKHGRRDRGAIQNIVIIAGPAPTDAYIAFVAAT